jgi:hypothetical protein
MSTSYQTTDPSTTNFNAIFEAASIEYKTLTGQGLETHPFAAALEDYVSPNSVLNVFRKQARAFDTFRKGEDRLMAWLTPIVYILFSVSETLGKGISLVSKFSLSMTCQSCNIHFLSPSLPQRHSLLLLVFFSG